LGKYIKIYFWQAVSLLFNFAAIFVVTPFISSNPSLYGIYSVVIAAYFFISYADFGFLSAGMKYASESYAQKSLTDEIEVIGFAGMIFLIFACLYSIGVFFIAFNPTVIFNGISSPEELLVAKQLLILLALTCPILVIQRVIQIIHSVRMMDYKFQRVLVLSNTLKLLSVFLFFGGGKYFIVEYFLFSQVCVLLAVITGLIMINSSLNYDLRALFRAFRLSNKLFSKTKKLAFTSIFLTVSWILYYELDPFAIARLFGSNSVAIYAIGFSIITYFRSIFGILFTPFIARFNHFIGLKDTEGLQLFFIKVMILFLPITLFPVLSVFLTVDNFILTWVGSAYTESISIAKTLVLCYVFSFITYPAGILIMANEKVKALYYTSALQPVIFWTGIIFTYKYLGLESFAYFKFIAFFLESIVYIFLVLKFLQIDFFELLRKVIIPIVIPTILVIVIVLMLHSYLPITKGKLNMLYYFINIWFAVLCGFFAYYYTSKVFKENVDNIITSLLQKRLLKTN